MSSGRQKKPKQERSDDTIAAAEDTSFDQILADLQQVVEQLEGSDLPLEQALQAFERGVALSRRGQQILDAAERKVDVLVRNGETEPFEPLSSTE